MNPRDYEIKIEQTTPLNKKGLWFEYTVTHKQTEMLVNFGTSIAKNENELRTRLVKQLKNKYNNPNFLPPRPYADKERARNYNICQL